MEKHLAIGFLRWVFMNTTRNSVHIVTYKGKIYTLSEINYSRTVHPIEELWDIYLASRSRPRNDRGIAD